MDQRNYLSRVATAFSQLTNAVILNGDPDESISGRSYRRGTLEHHLFWFMTSRVIDTLFFWEDKHCEGAYLFDVRRAKGVVARHENNV